MENIYMILQQIYSGNYNQILSESPECNRRDYEKHFGLFSQHNVHTQLHISRTRDAIKYRVLVQLLHLSTAYEKARNCQVQSEYIQWLLTMVPRCQVPK